MPLDAGSRGHDGKIELEVAPVEFLRNGKAGMTKDIDHAAVIELRDGPETRESHASGEKRQTLE